jgi:hypothetical protein
LLFLLTNGIETLTNEGQMNLTTSRIATAALLVAGASSAYAGQPVATLACSGGTSLSINLSHFDLGVSDSTSGSSTGGTAELMPLTLHASLGSFGTLFQAQASGSAIPSCTLTTQDSGGNTLQFTLQSVVVSNVTAVASAATTVSQRAAYTKATLTYATVHVTNPGTGVDDGGASEGGGWDIGANKSS